MKQVTPWFLKFSQYNIKQCFLAEFRRNASFFLFYFIFFIFLFFKLGFTPCKAEQPVRGMELQEKEAHQD